MTRAYCRHAGDEAINEPNSDVRRRAVFKWIAAVFLTVLRSSEHAVPYLSDVLPTMQRECKLLDNEQGLLMHFIICYQYNIDIDFYLNAQYSYFTF